jgi:hypothetical protein
MTTPDIDKLIEEICIRGCTYVYQVIEQLEQAAPTEELAHIPEHTHPILLRELKAIMAVYEARDEP